MIYNGSIRDTTNFSSDRYLYINSCNVQHSRGRSYTVIRERGRVDYHILYVAHGRCVCLYDGVYSELCRGDFVIYPPSVLQKYSFSEGVEVTTMWIHFTGTGVKELFSELGLGGGVFRARSFKEAEHYFKRLINFSYAGKRGGTVSERAYLMNLLSSLSGSEQTGAHRTSSPAVSSMLEFINSNWQRPISVAEFAGFVHLSESRANHLFSSVVGQSIHRYVKGVKISAAKELLTDSDMSVSQIAAFVGYEDPLYFSRVFKSDVGVSPLAFRS